MKHFLSVLVLGLVCCLASAQKFSWERAVMDGSRTGVVASTADNVAEALGRMDGESSYCAPNGRVFRGGVTPKVASLLLAAQEQMAPVKQVIAHSTREMIRRGPECELSNWFVDALMAAAERLSGKKVSLGIVNFGGIRVDMPEGDVLLDDIMSMFPFKNNICYLELSGKDILALLQQLASSGWQPVGGARCRVRDGRLVSAEIDGRPVEEDRYYGVATISFLLDGGDGIAVAKNSRNLRIFDEYILDVMLPYVRSLTAAGKPIEYSTDGRIVFED